MATVQPVQPSGSALDAGPATASTAVALRAAATALTTSYVASLTDVNCLGWDFGVLGLDYINGDETSLQVGVQGYDGVTWRWLTFKGTQAAGVSELTPDIINITKATINTFMGGTTVFPGASPPFNCRGYQKIRVMAKSTGGTPTGTLAVSASFGIQAGAVGRRV